MNWFGISALGGANITANGKKAYSLLCIKVWRFQILFFFEDQS